VDEDHAVLVGERHELLEEVEVDTVVVGLWGNDTMITRGRGHELRNIRSSTSK
jgi:hypothetical protein